MDNSIHGPVYDVSRNEGWPELRLTEEQLRQKMVCQSYEDWIMYAHEPKEIFQRYQHKIEEDFGTIPIKNMINIFEKYLEEIMVKDLLEKLQRRYEEEGYIVRHSQPEVKEVLKSWVEQQDKEPDSPTKFRSEVKDACFDRHFLTHWVDINPVSIQAVKEYKSQKREKTLYQQRLQELGKRRWRDADRIAGWKKLFCGRSATAEELDPSAFDPVSIPGLTRWLPQTCLPSIPIDQTPLPLCHVEPGSISLTPPYHQTLLQPSNLLQYPFPSCQQLHSWEQDLAKVELKLVQHDRTLEESKLGCERCIERVTDLETFFHATGVQAAVENIGNKFNLLKADLDNLSTRFASLEESVKQGFKRKR